ncbi:phage Gp37/Gp68 family protein [Novosphingobium sp. ES2-1]|uniref:phage Gp37/Gp68 family protein n=1 Tax=Novosphingobium sp. ES2-1 TaxID=2780074 RepID=UPI00187FE144|nr:phage Gp37/Gp68 family protein [Novosphingobium sp. ES2-1]QOV95238.1 phage Gp37/Gp68 family protein [Novosphingobium sp. ES2-1]
MADNTKIEWADATVNAINGCSVTSPGCTNCYAMKLAGTRMKTHPTRAGLTIESKTGPVWNGEVRLHEPALLQPLSWSKPRRIFWNAHGDTFHDAVPDEWIDRIFAVAALTPQHTHMILTKRSKRMREYMSACEVRVAQLTLELACATGKSLDDPRRHPAFRMVGEWGASIMDAPTIGGFEQWPVPNVWLGVSVEDQTRADERIPDLLATPAAVRFLSCEPLLGPVDLMHVDIGAYMNGLTGRAAHEYDPVCRWPLIKPFYHMQSGLTSPGIDWVIAGGESGPGARPMHPDWARSLRDQCAAAGVPFHFKQWGEWAPRDIFDDVAGLTTQIVRVGKKRAGRLLDGVEHNGFPGQVEGEGRK